MSITMKITTASHAIIWTAYFGIILGFNSDYSYKHTSTSTLFANNKPKFPFSPNPKQQPFDKQAVIKKLRQILKSQNDAIKETKELYDNIVDEELVDLNRLRFVLAKENEASSMLQSLQDEGKANPRVNNQNKPDLNSMASAPAKNKEFPVIYPPASSSQAIPKPMNMKDSDDAFFGQGNTAADAFLASSPPNTVNPMAEFESMTSSNSPPPVTQGFLTNDRPAIVSDYLSSISPGAPKPAGPLDEKLKSQRTDSIYFLGMRNMVPGKQRYSVDAGKSPQPSNYLDPADLSPFSNEFTGFTPLDYDLNNATYGNPNGRNY